MRRRHKLLLRCVVDPTKPTPKTECTKSCPDKEATYHEGVLEKQERDTEHWRCIYCNKEWTS